LKIKLQQIGCNQYVAGDDWYQTTGRFNPQWAIDPGPQEAPELWWWRVTAGGLAAGDTFAIHNQADEAVLASVAVSPVGAGVIETVVPVGTGVVVAHHVPAPPAVNAGSPRQMAVTQRRLTQMSTVVTPAPVRALAADLVDGRPMVLAVLDDEQRVFDLSVPHLPRLARVEQMAQLGGLIRAGDGWVAWGGFGALRLGADGYCVAPAASSPQDDGDTAVLAERPVRRVERSAEGLRIEYAEAQAPGVSRDWPGRFARGDGWLAAAARIGSLVVHADVSIVTIWRVTATDRNGARALRAFEEVASNERRRE
jgi:hypothetical protein